MRCFLTLFFLLFFNPFPSPNLIADDRPNVVFILMDDLRHDVFSFMNHPFVKTPHIDALARGGMHFENAFVTTSLCSPARASFLTGQYMHNHHVVNNADLMREGTVTFPQMLQQSGYETAFIGKWHMGGVSDAARPGFDYWVSFRGQGHYFPGKQKLNVNGQKLPQKKYMTDELTDYATSWITGSGKRNRPFLLYLSHKGVHGLYDPAPRHKNLYRKMEYTVPDFSSEDRKMPGKPLWVRDQRNSWHGVEFPYHGRADQSIAEMYRHYCEMVLSVDESVSRVVDSLRSINALENTLIIFTSDGGHLWGEHGLIDKRCAYEESIRIPFLAHWPQKIKPNGRSKSLIANIDVAPTLLDLAGINIPTQMDGKSLLSLLTTSPNLEVRDSLLYEYFWEPAFPQTPTTFALRQGNFKLIQYHGIWDTDELYDLQSDPLETTNLILVPEHQEKIRAMRESLHQRLKETGGLSISLGFKKNHGSNLRSPLGSRRARFPSHMIAPVPRK